MLSDAHYPAEKLWTAIRTLMSPTLDYRRAMIGALHEFGVAFMHGTPDWAKGGVRRVHEAAPFDALPASPEGTVPDWVNSASDDDLSRTRDALLALFVTAVEEQARQMDRERHRVDQNDKELGR